MKRLDHGPLLLNRLWQFIGHVQEEAKKLDKLPRCFLVTFEVMDRVVSALADFVSPISQGARKQALCPEIRHAIENVLASSAQILGRDIKNGTATRDDECRRTLSARILLHLHKGLSDALRPGWVRVEARCLREGCHDAKLMQQPSMKIRLLRVAYSHLHLIINRQYHEHRRILAVWATTEAAEFRPTCCWGSASSPHRFCNLCEVLAHNFRHLEENEVLVLSAMGASVSNLEDSHVRL